MSSLGTVFSISNVIVPRGGPKTIPQNLDFSNTPIIEIDGELVVSQGQIEYLQGVFIDNSENATAFSLTMQGTGQKIVAAPNSQGYYAILVQTPPKMTAETTQAANRIIPVMFYNVPIQSATWSTL